MCNHRVFPDKTLIEFLDRQANIVAATLIPKDGIRIHGLQVHYKPFSLDAYRTAEVADMFMRLTYGSMQLLDPASKINLSAKKICAGDILTIEKLIVTWGAYDTGICALPFEERKRFIA